MVTEFLSATYTAGVEEIPNFFVVLMGIGTVFVGLVSIIIICLITGALFGSFKKSRKETTKSLSSGKGSEQVKDLKLVAAVCAACAEDMGTDVNSLKVVSFKKI